MDQLCHGKQRKSISPAWIKLFAPIFPILNKNPICLILLKHSKSMLIPKHVESIRTKTVDFSMADFLLIKQLL